VQGGEDGRLATMDSMKELKDWLVTKCRFPGFQHTLQPPDRDAKFASNVVTPKSIPEFVIPGSQESSRNPSICSSDDMRSHSSGMSVTCSPLTSPAVSPRNSLAGLAVPDKSPVRVRSAPVSPRRDSHGFLRDFGARSSINLSNGPVREAGEGRNGTTNGTDIYLKICRSSNNANGSFKDSPRSRRRDSQQSINSNAHLKCEPGQDGKYRRGFMRRPFLSHESLSMSHDASGAACAVPEHSCLSATTSPRRCSPVFTDQNDYLPLRESFRRSQRYYRRRSSLAQVEMTTALWRQQAEAEGRLLFTGGGGPSLLAAPSHHHHHHKRHSAPSTSSVSDPSSSSGSGRQSPGTPLHGHDACSSGVATPQPARDTEDGEARDGRGGGGESPVGERGAVVAGGQNGADVVKTVTERGDIKFSFQYFPATRRLKLLLIRGENLRFPEKPDIVTNPFFKVRHSRLFVCCCCYCCCCCCCCFSMKASSCSLL
jgi:hypothetical protein